MITKTKMKNKMEKLIKETNNHLDKPYEVCKLSEEELREDVSENIYAKFNKYGRQYNLRGLATLLNQTRYDPQHKNIEYIFEDKEVSKRVYKELKKFNTINIPKGVYIKHAKNEKKERNKN